MADEFDDLLNAAMEDLDVADVDQVATHPASAAAALPQKQRQSNQSKKTRQHEQHEAVLKQQKQEQLDNSTMDERLQRLYENETMDEGCKKLLRHSKSLNAHWKTNRAEIEREGPGVLNGCVSVAADGQSMEFSANATPVPGMPNMTMFHTACLTPDFMWVDELIMLGADTDKLTGDGESPVFLAISGLMGTTAIKGRMSANTGVPEAMMVAPMMSCRERVLRRLLEVGVDATLAPTSGRFKRYTPLHLACGFGATSLIRILLEYLPETALNARAGPDSQRPADMVPSDVRTAYKMLLKASSKARKKGRPAPKCWCLSGEPLSKCHGGKGKEVRLNAWCPCDSGKKYARCCKKRGVVFTETRDSFAEQRVLTDPLAVDMMTKVMEQQKAQAAAEGREIKPTDKVFGGLTKEKIDAAKTSMMDMLMKMNAIDPAFAYAAKTCDFMPGLWRTKIPKNEQVIRQNEWNTAVDEYIASALDERSEFEIAVEAKIGTNGGPLYQRCNMPGCKEMEKEAGAGGKKFSMCGKCKDVVYCSKECQKAHWFLEPNSHKKGCGTDKLVVCRSQNSINMLPQALAKGM